MQRQLATTYEQMLTVYSGGNVGHYAEVCSSAERLCYNCKLFTLSHITCKQLLLTPPRQASNQVSLLGMIWRRIHSDWI
jgi:hypothetical protein